MRRVRAVCIRGLTDAAPVVLIVNPMRAWVFIFAAFVSSCSNKREPSVLTIAAQVPTILDQVVANAEYSKAIVEAERDLPSDRWEDKPFRFNASRDQRVSAVGNRMLDSVKPRFKEMSVSNLVSSFKIVPYPHGDLTNRFREVEEYVYAVGNQLIINEIKSRPAGELRGLAKLGSDKVMLVEGPQGFGLPLTWDLAEILEDRGLTNGWSR